MRLRFASFLLLVPLAFAADDVTPPSLTALSISPASIDTTASSATVNVAIHVTDDLSGFQSGYVRFASPSAKQSAVGSFGLPPVSGTALDGVYNAVLTFPRYAEAGIWTIDLVVVGDATFNNVAWNTAQLAAVGFPTSLSVASISDLEPPALASLSLTPSSIDTSADAATVTLTTRITDNLAGMQSAYFRFASPSGQQSVVASFGPSPVSGNALDGVYAVDAIFPQFAESGTWTLDQAVLSDAVNNTVYLTRDQIAAAGFPTTVDVISTPDTTPPVLAGFSFTPSTVDASAGPATVTITTRVTDDRSGFAAGYARFVSPSLHQEVVASFSPTSGAPTDAAFTVGAIFPQFAEIGTWTIDLVVLSDAAHNTVYLTTADLAAAGFATTVTVGAPTIPVSIDIKPGSSPNLINSRSKGTIPVAILSSASFDAGALDLSSLTFGHSGEEKSLAQCNGGLEDVNGDGRPDRICHFHTEIAAFAAGDTQGLLKGKTIAGGRILGSDSIQLKP